MGKGDRANGAVDEVPCLSLRERGHAEGVTKRVLSPRCPSGRIHFVTKTLT